MTEKPPIPSALVQKEQLGKIEIVAIDKLTTDDLEAMKRGEKKPAFKITLVHLPSLLVLT